MQTAAPEKAQENPGEVYFPTASPLEKVDFTTKSSNMKELTRKSVSFKGKYLSDFLSECLYFVILEQSPQLKRHCRAASETN